MGVLEDLQLHYIILFDVIRARITAPLHYIVREETKGRFRKGRFWQMYRRSGFRSGDTCERTLVPVFRPGKHANIPSFRFFVLAEHPKVPSFRFSFRGNIR